MKSIVKDLVSNDQMINMTASVLMISQRMYALARLALQKELAKEGYKWEDGVEEFIMQAMKAQSVKPFNRKQVLDGITQTCLPFLTEDVSKELEDQKYEELKKINDNEPIDLDGVLLRLPKLLRGNVAIYYGTKDCCHQLIQKIATKVTENHASEDDTVRKNCLMRLSAMDLGRFIRDRGTRPRSLQIGRNAWHDLATSRATFERFFNKQCESMHAKRCDVLIIEHLPDLACSHLSTDRVNASPAAVADAIEKSLKLLSRWCQQHKVAAFVTINQDKLPLLPRYQHPERLEQLLTTYPGYTYIEGELKT